jgi:hypothetical protein
MAKRFVISEEERSDIRSKYGLVTEQNEDDRIIGEFIYDSEWDLGFFNYRDIKMVDGEKYTIFRVERRDYEGWVVIGGIMKSNEFGLNRYAFIISPKEFKILKNKINNN